MTRALGFAALMSMLPLAAGLAGCGDDDSTSCTPGTPACTCTAGGTCNAGLTCAAGKCVNAGGSDAGAVDGPPADGPAPDGGPSETDPNVICASMLAYCQRFNECAPYFVGLEFGTVARCAERLKLSCVDAVLAPDSGLTGAAMAACAAALPAASCADLVYNNIAACNFAGTRPVGAACGTNEQCASGRCAKHDSTCGVCAERVADGAACLADLDCLAGRVCNGNDQCVLPAAAGAPCSASAPCGHATDCVAGTCQASATMAGPACTAQGGCSLAHALYCTPSSVCAAIPLNPPDGACDASTTSPALCAAGTCVLPPVGDKGVCEGFAADGAPCGEQAEDRLCQTPALCIGGRCSVPSSAACN
jgi:hypothetical protein